MIWRIQIMKPYPPTTAIASIGASKAVRNKNVLSSSFFVGSELTVVVSVDISYVPLSLPF